MDTDRGCSPSKKKRMLTAASALVLHSAQCFTRGVGGMGCKWDRVLLLQLHGSTENGDRPGPQLQVTWVLAMPRSGNARQRGDSSPCGQSPMDF